MALLAVGDPARRLEPAQGMPVVLRTPPTAAVQQAAAKGECGILISQLKTDKR